jgi:hypothetical protein
MANLTDTLDATLQLWSDGSTTVTTNELGMMEVGAVDVNECRLSGNLTPLQWCLIAGFGGYIIHGIINATLCHNSKTTAVDCIKKVLF